MRTVIAWTVLSVLLLPLFVASAWAIIPSVDPVAKAQRIIMMANQVKQITQAVSTVTTLTNQLTELKAQFQHIKDATLGEVQALTQPFTQLASAGTGIVSDGMSWKSQFSGVPGQLANAVTQMASSGSSITGTWSTLLQQADAVSEADITSLYTNLPPTLSQEAAEGWRKNRERADNTVVMNNTVADAAAELAEALKEAKDAIEDLKNQTNMSNTALAQAHLAGSLTSGSLAVAKAQLQAYEAALKSTEAFQQEQRRRDQLSAWADAQRAAQQNLQTRNAAIRAQSAAMREGLRLDVNPYYGYSYTGQ